MTSPSSPSTPGLLPGASDPALQPLLPSPHSPHAPHLAQCLLAPSRRLLQTICFCCFIVHLYRQQQLYTWCVSVVTSLQADFFWPISLGLCTASCYALLKCTLGSERPFFAYVLIFLAVVCHVLFFWFGLVQICELYKLTMRCWISSMCRFTALAWLPIGAVNSVVNALWRPWYVGFYVIPLGIVGKGPLLTMPWWMWREVIVGGVFWFYVIFLLLAIRSSAFRTAIADDRRFLILIGCVCGIMCTILTFWLTVPPLVDYIAFLLIPWVVICRDPAVHHVVPRLSAEEWVAVAAMLWAITRAGYLGAIAQLGRFAARQHMEEMLSDALAHPYRAELEQGFGDGFSHGLAAVAALSRSSDQLGEDNGVDIESCEGSARGSTKTLKEKHKALLALRKELLLRQVGCKAALPTSLRLSISRDRILEDTFAALFGRPVTELLAPKVSVKFEGELGIDAGGVTRDWFDSVGRCIVEQAQRPQSVSLLVPAPDQTLIPRSVCSDYGAVSLEQQERFRALLALGRFLALAVFHEHPLPVSFSLILCKHLMRVPVGMSDMRQLDPEFYNGRVASVLKAGGLAEVNAALGEPLTFMSAGTESSPNPEELKPNGANILVTDENKTEYVQLLCEAYLCGGIRREIQCLLQGFWDVLPLEVLMASEVKPRELSLLLSGIGDLDPKEWQAMCEGDTSEEQFKWFWQVVQELNSEQRCMLLHFTTGSSRLPPGGWADLSPRFTVKVTDGGSDTHLPHAHTCANQIVLHRYKSMEQLRDKLLHAILTEDFGFS